MIESSHLRTLVYDYLKDIQWKPNALNEFMVKATDNDIVTIIKENLDDNFWLELVRNMERIRNK